MPEVDVSIHTSSRANMNVVGTRIEERDREYHTGGRDWLLRIDSIIGDPTPIEERISRIPRRVRKRRKK
jgi:hypothetical protein